MYVLQYYLTTAVVTVLVGVYVLYCVISMCISMPHVVSQICHQFVSCLWSRSGNAEMRQLPFVRTSVFGSSMTMYSCTLLSGWSQSLEMHRQRPVRLCTPSIHSTQALPLRK